MWFFQIGSLSNVISFVLMKLDVLFFPLKSKPSVLNPQTSHLCLYYDILKLKLYYSNLNCQQSNGQKQLDLVIFILSP